jgi:SH3-like domain-containing protein
MVERTGTGPAPSPEVPRAVRVTASRADVRAGPTEKSDVLATLERGEVLEWLERRGQWHRVRDLARPLEGYVHASIEAAIKRFATDVPPAGRDPFTGHGAINPRGTLLGLSLAR